MSTTEQDRLLNSVTRRRLQVRKRHTRFTVVKRIVHLAVVITATAIALSLYGLSSQYYAQWTRLHLSEPGQSLSFQYAAILSEPTSQRDTAAIERLLGLLEQDPAVIKATVFDVQGRELANAGEPVPLVSNQLISRSPVTFLRDITGADDQLYGYFQLVLDRELTLSQALSLHQQNTRLLAGLILLATLGAIYLTRGVYKSKYWYIRHLSR